MDSALHPLDGRTIDVLDYLAEGGSASGKPAPGGLPVRCPVCLGELVLTSDHGNARHFKHRLISDEARCPLATSSYQLEGLAVSRLCDPELEKSQRTPFIERWTRYYSAMKKLAPSLTIERFTRLIRYADVLHLWSYRNLAHQDLPYVLLALGDFMIQRPREGPLTWVRFCFDAGVRDVGTLWEPGARQAQFFRMVYREPPQTPFPTAKQLMRWDVVPRDGAFLSGLAPRTSRADLQAFQRLLASSEASGQPDEGRAAPSAPPHAGP